MGICGQLGRVGRHNILVHESYICDFNPVCTQTLSEWSFFSYEGGGSFGCFQIKVEVPLVPEFTNV